MFAAVPTLVVVTCGILKGASMSIFALESYREGARRALMLAILLAISCWLLAAVPLWVSSAVTTILATGILAGAVVSLGVLAFPAKRTEYHVGSPAHRYDERDIPFGALSAGTSELCAMHLYSHIGRGAGQYGEPIQLEHTFAIASTVEMDFQMTTTAPAAPEVVETARKYAESAVIAVQLAAFIRKMGYPARAHIDGNYRVIAPLVARDAGLGTIGRLGLLMTPTHGPRVRLGVVTTTMPLQADRILDELPTLDICSRCKKCAENCPSHAISFDDRKLHDGVTTWKINADSCFRYWNVLGTDCGRCLYVCPYSHPDSTGHNLVRWAIQRSSAARRIALKLDDIFYGKHPNAGTGPNWTRAGLSDVTDGVAPN